jgi:hypothetical protein
MGYHITPRENVPNIIKMGLIPNYRSNWDDYFGENSERGIFFTISPGDVQFWMEQYDDPVVLRFKYDINELIGDDTHTESQSNFIIPRAVPAEDIAIWTGTRWISASKFKKFAREEGNYQFSNQKELTNPRTVGNFGTGTLYTHKGDWSWKNIQDIFPDSPYAPEDDWE